MSGAFRLHLTLCPLSCKFPDGPNYVNMLIYRLNADAVTGGGQEITMTVDETK
jgi:hypothetical protein